MAKKNSSKTATEKAIQSSEPRVMTYRGWQGVNYVDAPLTWQPLETGKGKFRQTDLPDNYLMVQNNLITTDTMGIETRPDSIVIGRQPKSIPFTGVSCMYKHWIFCVVDAESQYILYKDVDPEKDDPDTWQMISVMVGGTSDLRGIEILEIGFFESNMVATAKLDGEGILLLAKVEVSNDDAEIHIKGMNWANRSESLENTICDTPKIKNFDSSSPAPDRPGVSPVITANGLEYSYDHATDAAPVLVEVKYCYTNRLGSTLTQLDYSATLPHCATIFVELSPAHWTAKKYVTITPSGPDTFVDLTSVTGIDFYGRDTENLDWVFIGHIDVTPDQITNPDASRRWSYNWYGNMTDITQWLTSQLMVPTDNTTHGPDATHFSCHDSRMYYWGMPSKPYRLWIGGNPGAEFSIARGLGGAWVDIEPGSGYDIMGTAKWKTVSGANIVTIMCGNRNTTKVKRFNLVETNLTLTNEVAYKSYMYEEVSNVVGCNSRWGYGVFSDGLYSLNRYGLMLTTMAMEYNSQMKNQSMSDVIEPIFTNLLGKYLRDGRMVCINDVIYIAFSDEGTHLDNVILCYDMNLKAWYTWTHDQDIDHTKPDTDEILHILAIDSDEYIEGLGAITETEVRLYPIAGHDQGVTVPEFTVLMESGELAPRQPMQAFWYVQQLELRFDYYIGSLENPATILVEGVDYYGRQFKIEKQLNKRGRRWQTINDNGEHIVEIRNHLEYVRIDKLVQSYRIRIKGNARFRLTHINAKLYQQSDTISTPYGFDAHDTYYDRHDDDHEIHHYIDDYNNLRRAVVS